MAKTVAYFYDPDVGNFHYGEGTRLCARGLDAEVSRQEVRLQGWELTNSLLPTPRSWAPYEAPSPGIDS